VVHGLTRVRGITQDDAHIFCTREQMGDELARCSTSCSTCCADYGLDDFYLELSTKPEEKSVGTDEEWDEATEALRAGRRGPGLELVLDEGGGAFYGPKISCRPATPSAARGRCPPSSSTSRPPQRFGSSTSAPTASATGRS
jgi:threonyl-tRNA synthetase